MSEINENELNDKIRDSLKTDRLVDAMHWMARTNPKLFRLMAEDFVRGFVMRRSNWSVPIEGDSVDEWLREGYLTQHIAEIFPVGTEHEPREMPELNVEDWSEETQQIMNVISTKFGGDHYRWDTATRDQFILLGTTAFGGARGVTQNVLTIQMGLGSDDSLLVGSNAVRAAKVALTRAIHAIVGREHEVFAKAVGSGGYRRHWIASEELRQAIAVYCASHPGNIMLPEPDFETIVRIERLRYDEGE